MRFSNVKGPEGHTMLLRLFYAALVTEFTERVIDLDAGPFVPDGWKLEEHQKGGQFEWNPANVKLHLSPNQQGGNGIEGNKLREELKGKSSYNANLLDYLLKNPDLIPEQWKGKYVYFWGTVYSDSGNKACVRCLCWHRSRPVNWPTWRWHYGWLDSDFVGNEPAAVPALLPALSTGRIVGKGAPSREREPEGVHQSPA
jgi:hypothetical protein